MIDDSDSTGTKSLDFKPQPMCKWFEPIPLIGIAAKVIISDLFGNFADKREVQAALISGNQFFSYQDRDELWLDYVADLGDGFNSTYTVASLLAQPTLYLNAANGQTCQTKRGTILMMGGDQVYPLASRENYHNHTVGPYQSALPWIENEALAPHLFAIPGNHDWYDGLTSFTRQFCQQRWIGGWKTQQQASYFALQLPHRWWLFALDIQLEADIDKPQLDYFTSVMQQLQPGDSVILATSTPSWVYESFFGQSAQENINFIEKRIEKQGATIKVNLAGDLHHFAHYTNAGSTRHRITSGGGGAFLHGTHQIPDELNVSEVSKKNAYQLKTCFPNKEESKKATLGNLAFPWYNPWLCLFLSSYLLLTTWVAQSASLGIGQGFLQTLINPTGNATLLSHLWDSCLQQCSTSPATTGFVLFFFAGLIGFCDPAPGTNQVKRWLQRVGIGAIHATLQLTIFLLLLVGFVQFNHSILQLALFSGWHIFWLCLEMLLIGSVSIGILWGMYLYVTARYWNFHAEAGFSSCHIEDFKNFLRLHISPEGKLTIYPVGIRVVEKNWKRTAQSKKDAPFFSPAGDMRLEDRVHLMEPPIEINGRSAA